MMFVEELQLELTGFQLALWLGHHDDGTPVNVPEPIRQRQLEIWRKAAAGTNYKRVSDDSDGAGAASRGGTRG